MVLIVLLGAFELTPVFGRSSGMGAGVAVDDWRQSGWVNPALALAGTRFGVGAAYCRPYGLAGLHWGAAGFKVAGEERGASFAISTLGFEDYYEHDIVIDFAGAPFPPIGAGVGAHFFIISAGDSIREFVPGFDAGVLFSQEKFRAGLAGRRLNRPRLRDRTVLLPQLCLGGCWRPVEELLIGLDFVKEGAAEGLLAGMEFWLFRELAVRCGVATYPLVYRGGVGLKLGGFGLDYGYEFHPELGDSHRISLVFEWN